MRDVIWPLFVGWLVTYFLAPVDGVDGVDGVDAVDAVDVVWFFGVLFAGVDIT